MSSSVTKLPTTAKPAISPEEWQARVDLAAAYRLTELYDMSDMIYTHISARVPGEPNHFLLNSFGMLFDQITASSLLKVDLEGNVISESGHGFGLQRAGFVIHSALYLARPDVNAAVHTHTTAGMAVSSLKCGLTSLTQTAHRFYGRLAYHDFNGPERDPSERGKLAEDLGSMNYAVLRNHGLLTVGASVPEAFNYMYGLERACRAQVAAMSCNTPLNDLTEAVVAKSTALYEPGATHRYGVLEWPGLLARLDRLDPSYKD